MPSFKHNVKFSICFIQQSQSIVSLCGQGRLQSDVKSLCGHHEPKRKLSAMTLYRIVSLYRNLPIHVQYIAVLYGQDLAYFIFIKQNTPLFSFCNI